MEFNSQICTTKEQSERLLKLRLKPETADMAYIAFGGGGMMIRPYDWLCTTKVDIYNFYPAWSLHRLIEIRFAGDNIGFGVYQFHNRNFGNCYEILISVIEHLIKIGEFNKEYLKQ